MTKKIYLSVCLLIGMLMASGSYAQDQGFQRIYSAEETLLLQKSSIPSIDGGYFISSVTFSQDLEFFLHITKHDVKGDIEWAREYTYDGFATIINTKSVDLQILSDGSLFVTSILLDLNNGLKNEHLLMKVRSDDGSVTWSNEIFVDRDAVFPLATNPVAQPHYDGSMMVYSTQTQIDSLTGNLELPGVNISKLNDNNNFEYNNLYRNIDPSDDTELIGLTSDAHYDPIDSSQIYSSISEIAGIPTPQGIAIITTSTAINKNDQEGTPVFANNYSVDTLAFPIFQMQLAAVATAPDSSYFAIGLVQDLLSGVVDRVVLKTDFNGKLVWAKSLISVIPQTDLSTNDIEINSSGQVVIVGKYFDVTNLAGGDYSITMDLDGNIISQEDYASDNSALVLVAGGQVIDISTSDLNHMPDGNMLLTANGIDPLVGTFTTYAIKMDTAGHAMCSDTFTLAVIEDYSFITEDTLSVVVTPFATADTIEVQDMEFTRYINPVLTLSDTNYCPQDPINFTIDAFLPEATAYMWSTGDTTSDITVMEEGEFSVTVTMGGRVCYSLCDTATVSKFDLPMADIREDLSRECFEGIVTLDAILTAGAGPKSYLWNTGETSSSIEITESGSYIVTVTDNCDNMDSDTLNFNFDTTVAVTINKQEQGICDDKTVRLTLTTDEEIESYQWSTGSMDEEIVVNENGTYSVTVIDICGDIGEKDIEVTEDLSIPTLTLSSIDVDNSDCEQGILLTVNASNSDNLGITSYNWSSGEQLSVDTLRVMQAGEYTVTVTDLCGTTAEGSVNVSFDDQLQWPNIFFPDSNLEINRTFGPHVDCAQLFQATDYQLSVYNRWGNKVFEGSSVGDRWNGRKDNAGSDINPRDTYMFIYSYIDGAGLEQKGGGHVILSR